MRDDPFSVLAGVELRDDEGTPFGVPSGFDAWLWARAAPHRRAQSRQQRLEAIQRLLGCDCWRCQVDAADVLAGRRQVSRDRRSG